MKRGYVLIGTAILLIISGVIIGKVHRSPFRWDADSVEREGEHGDGFEKEVEDEFHLLRDPKTGKVPRRIHHLALEQSWKILSQRPKVATGTSGGVVLGGPDPATYPYQGPSNLGGRTRALAFDVSDPSSKTILAGSVSGSLFKTTNGGQTWSKVSPYNQIYSITGLAQDTRAGFQNTWYYAGGEYIIYSDASADGALYGGDGVYKSVDGGNTWNLLASSDTGSLYTADDRADFIYRIAVNPTNGDIYVAMIGQIMRSQDGGNTWSIIMGTPIGTSTTNDITDVAITSTGTIYASFSGTCGSGLDGFWSSTTGNPGDWTHLAGTGSALTASGWRSYNNYGRVVFGIAPSNENIIYAMYYNDQVASCSNVVAEADLFQYNAGTSTWVNLSANLPSASSCSGSGYLTLQGGYDMLVSVNPNDPNQVMIGATNLFYSGDGGNSWNQIGGYGDNPFSSAGIHFDFHIAAYSPFNSNLLLCGTDGGVYETNFSTIPNNPISGPVFWQSLNNGYNTLQYYGTAVKPEMGDNVFIGGAQDNGTTLGTSSSSAMSFLYSGDGVSVGLGSTNGGDYQYYFGLQNGGIVRQDSVNSTSVGLTPTGDSSIFVTYFFLDPDNTENLYYACFIAGQDNLLRITNASTSTASDWQTFSFNFDGYVRSMASTRGAYTSSSRLYMGTDDGRIYYFTDPVNTSLSSTPTDISPPGMGGSNTTVVGLAVNPNDQNELLAVYSNYGIINIWHTSDAGDASPIWQNIEGNLSLPSIRSCLILINGTTPQYFVGTEVGLFSTTLLNGNSTVWGQESPDGLGNALVVSLSLRPSDNTFVVGTHGSGMWVGQAGAPTPLPLSILSFTGFVNPQGNGDLVWSTSGDVIDKGFEVQRSYDGVNFSTIGYVTAQNGYATTEKYSFTDSSMLQNNNYYRLNEINQNGESNLSKIVLLKGTRSQSIKILENPFSSYIDIQLNGFNSGSQVSIQLLDIAGRSLILQTVNYSGSVIRFDVSSLGLPKAVYVLKVIIGNKKQIFEVTHLSN